MRFVDEYRDPTAARALVARITAAGRRRRLQVHGGVRRPHPHHLPARDRARPAANVELVHGPGLPGLRHPDGPGRRRHRRGGGARRHLHLVRRHDASARQQGQPAQGQGRGRRRPLRVLAARRPADRDRESRTARWSSSQSASRRPPRRRPSRCCRPGPGRSATSASSPTTSRSSRRSRPSSSPRISASTASSGRATCPRWSASGPTGSCRPQYGKPLVTAGFEPLDILQAIAMLLTQIREGRCEVENQYSRVVREEGNPRALRRPGRGLRAAAPLRVARARLHLAERPQAAAGVRGLRRRAALRDPRRAGGRPQGVPVRRGAQGCDQALGVQGVRHGLHARDAHRHVHGLVRGGVRGLLQLRPDAPRGRGDPGREAGPDRVIAAAPSERPVRHRIRVAGVVQGVGFRPFVHRLAPELGLAGHVGNDTDGVFVEVEGSPDAGRPVSGPAGPGGASAGPGVPRRDDRGRGRWRRGVSYRREPGPGPGRTFVSPDVAVCDDCLAELFDPADRRYRYPFTNCTNCGPRFTITARLPYDRPNTTMAGFPLCPTAGAEYHDPADRRFHAQPIACPACGPRLWFEGAAGGVMPARRRRPGGSPAGAGGRGDRGHQGSRRLPPGLRRHLGRRRWRSCATASTGMEKPFAVMVADLDGGQPGWPAIEPAQAELLAGPSARSSCCAGARTRPSTPGVAPGNPDLGVLLPYTPLHHLLFARSRGP